MNLGYTTGIPDTPKNPSNDQPLMKINNDSNSALWAVDHFGFNNDEGGWHNLIHLPIQNFVWPPNPALIPGVAQLYSSAYTPNTTGGIQHAQLFATNDGGTVQMTGTLQQSDGWAWCNGLLVQWGSITPVTMGSFGGGNAIGTVTFKDRAAGCIPFPNNCFSVIPVPFWTTASTVPNGAASVNINQSTLNPLSFDWRFNSNSNNYRGFYWIAVGN